MQQFAREEYDLVLLWHDRLIAAVADVRPILQVRVMNSQFSALELAWFAVEEIDERQMSRRHSLAAVVAMEVEEVSVITGGNLCLDIRDRKLLHLQLRPEPAATRL